jgi:hypothetical protein
MSTIFNIGTPSTSFLISGVTQRIVVAASALSGTATRVRVKFLHGGTDWTVNAAVAGVQASSGDVYDYDPLTAVTITQGGNASFTVTAANPWSDWFDLPVSGSTPLVIVVYVSSSSPGYVAGPITGYSRYYKSGNDAATADVTGYSESSSYIGPVGEMEGIVFTTVAAVYDQPVDGVPGVAVETEESLALSLGADFFQPLSQASIISNPGYQPLVFGSPIQRACVQCWDDAVALQMTVGQQLTLLGGVSVATSQLMTLLGVSVTGEYAQPLGLSPWIPVRETSHQGVELVGGETTVISAIPSLLVTPPPVPPTQGNPTPSAPVAQGLDPVSISISGSLDQYSLSLSLGLATREEYLACPPGSALTMDLAGTSFSFRVEGRARNREHGSAAYSITALSPAAWLDAPYAETLSAEYTGLASTIAATLAGSIPLSWQTVDWTVAAGSLLAANETPLSLIRKLAAAVGAVVHSLPNGSMVVLPAYPLAVPTWAASSPGWISTDEDVITSVENYDHRPGFNRYIISDELATTETVRLEQESIDSQRVRLRAYRTPWQAVTIRHTGGDWVSLVALDIETREVEEVVEFVAGEGRSQYPIYEVVRAEWQQVNLGSITPGEDGMIRAAVEAESLLALTYRTRCWMWEARSPQIEQVQFVAEVDA